MDAHDAILEQLQRAQKRALEAMTNRLDFVVERLDDLLKEARSEIKEAVPEDAEELFPLAEIASEIEKLKAQVGGGQGAGPSASLFSAVSQLEQASSQSELLKELLPIIQGFAARAVVLVVRGDAIQAWSGIGFSDGEKLKGWQAELSSSDAIAGFAKEMKSIRLNPKDDPVLKNWLADEGMGEEAIIAPVVLRGSLVGGIYADRRQGQPWEPETVQLLVAVACWLIDTLQGRSSGLRLLAEPKDLRSASGEVETPEELELELDEPVVEELDELDVSNEVVEQSPEEALQQSDEFDPSATMRVEVPPSPNEVTQTIPEEENATPTPAEAPVEIEEVAEVVVPDEEPPAESEAAPADEPPPVSAVVPPDDPPPVSAVVPPEPEPEGGLEGEEESQKLEEARRFARLLVSEIKLYNEEEIDKGKVSQDIYKRLREDIDRSREMFEKRIPPDVREGKDLFREELARILADGDDDALGM